MMFALRKSWLCGLLILLIPVNLGSKDKFGQANNNIMVDAGWPDMFWLKNLQLRVEVTLKGFYNSVYARPGNLGAAELNSLIQAVFDTHKIQLKSLNEDIGHTSLERFMDFFEKDHYGLNDWLAHLGEQLDLLKQSIMSAVNQFYLTATSKTLALNNFYRLQLTIRQQFERLFVKLSDSWQQYVPELLQMQTDLNHERFMELSCTKRSMDYPTFIRQLSMFRQELDGLLSRDFRSATNPDSVKARLSFYELAMKISAAVRFFDYGLLSGLTDEQYTAIYKLFELMAKTIVNRQPQFSYDQLAYNEYVKKQLWIMYYWFYNVFPYKTFPWPDENMLQIENIFRDVATALNLGAAYAFKFNHQHRNKFRRYKPLAKTVVYH